MKRHDISIALIFTTVVGCGLLEERREVQNEGKLCAFPAAETSYNPHLIDPAPRDFLADAIVNIGVHLPGCLSSTCDRGSRASCSVEKTGNVLRVTSTGLFVHKTATACSDDCGALVAKCATPVLAAGTYTVEHAGMTLQLTLPSSVPPPCIDSGAR